MNKMNLYKNLKNKFGNIVVLTMSNRLDRQHAIFDQLYKIGYDDSDSIRVHYATPFPYNDLIIDAFNKSGRGRFSKPNEFDCSRNHYSIIKTAYDLGYEHILVMEDDIRFLKDTDIFNNYIENIPEDFDILQFGAFTADQNIAKYLNGSNLWFKHKDVGIWNASMYALSRKGMEYFIAFMNKIFWVADGPFYKAPLNDKLINTYLCKTPLVIQADKDQVSSDIRNVNNDNIDYNNQNMYEKYIDKNDYFEYKIS